MAVANTQADASRAYRIGIIRVLFTTVLILWFLPGRLPAERVSDIANTKHNLSVSGPGSVKATAEKQICVFCHTPHGAENIPKGPLWNRKLSGSVYTTYDSSSMDGTDIGLPTQGSSRLCLSCHDGAMAVGAVNVLAGSVTDQDPATEDITMTGTDAGGVMPDGSGDATGYTRDLGVDLTNDHPISFTYDSVVAGNDGDLYDPALAAHIGNRGPGGDPAIPLVDNEVECVTCHDPHIRDDTVTHNIKFLRLKRFQNNTGPIEGSFTEGNDIICLGCHDKEGWVSSAHANPVTADEVYASAAASSREFPDALPVWRAACLNCHDTHTVQGARRLLREGTDGTGVPKQGGSSAIEETCYQCHSDDGATLTSQGTYTEVPDIKSDFQLFVRMPITTADQVATDEVHDIGTGSTGGEEGKEFTESQLLLGKGDLNNRHAECTDCHNPHRVIKNRLATDDPSTPDAAGTHTHSSGVTHTNIVSGVLRGMWGVEPTYTSSRFNDGIITYTVKKGLQPIGGGTDASQPYVTREYQICFKCHSDFSYDESNRPTLGSFSGGTMYGTNNMTRYTNQAREFQAPAGHEAEGQSLGYEGGACSNYDANNHRGWHPVMKPTGRTVADRGNMDPDNFLPPWNEAIGTQTMYCSDCHGSDTDIGTSEPSGGEDGNPWGPHGSTNDFILKGNWTGGAGSENPDALCFKCHDYDDYANPDKAWAVTGVSAGKSGFRTWPMGPGPSSWPMGGEAPNNLHIGHAWRLKYTYGTPFKCNWCHVAVPHGFKNKALLVNIIDVGPEVGEAECTNYFSGPYGTYICPTCPEQSVNKDPYYLDAMAPVGAFATSGSWGPGNCQGTGWMIGTCSNPP